MPTFDPAGYYLGIEGLLERPPEPQLVWVAALPGEDQVSDFHCVTGWSVRDVRWGGVRASTIIDMVTPMPSAR